MEWLVRWEMMFDADTAEEAARKALEVQRDPDSIAVVFDVRPVDDNDAFFTTVDLLESD